MGQSEHSKYHNPSPATEDSIAQSKSSSDDLPNRPTNSADETPEAEKQWEHFKPLYEEWLRRQHPEWTDEQVTRVVEEGKPSDETLETLGRILDESSNDTGETGRNETRKSFD